MRIFGLEILPARRLKALIDDRNGYLAGIRAERAEADRLRAELTRAVRDLAAAGEAQARAEAQLDAADQDAARAQADYRALAERRLADDARIADLESQLAQAANVQSCHRARIDRQAEEIRGLQLELLAALRSLTTP